MIMIISPSVAIKSSTATITTVTTASAMTVSITITFNIPSTLITLNVFLRIFLLLRLWGA